MTLATQRGLAFEDRITKQVKGTKYAGKDGDVDVTGTNIRLECKYALGLRRLKTKEYHDQILAYEKRDPDRIFALAYTGGKSYQNARVWVTLPFESFLEFVEFKRRQDALETLGITEEQLGKLTSH